MNQELKATTSVGKLAEALERTLGLIELNRSDITYLQLKVEELENKLEKKND